MSALLSNLKPIGNGLSANDGTGDTLRIGAGTIETNNQAIVLAVNKLAGSQAGGSISYLTKAAMDGDLAHSDGTIALVTNDPTDTNNRPWRKTGASGAGSWGETVDRLAAVLGNGAGFQGKGTGAVVLTVQQKGRQRVSVYDYIPEEEHSALISGSSNYDCSAAFEAALAASLNVRRDEGTLNVSRPIKVTRNGQVLRGGGQNCCTIRALPSFPTGEQVVIFGNRDAPIITETVSGRGFTVDCGSRAIEGVAVYGVRDGSSFKRIRVKNALGVHFRTGKAGNASGAAGGLMSQGVHFESLHAVSTANTVTGNVYMIDGLFESTFISCKVLAGSANNNVATGFAIGTWAECRAVLLDQCAIGNLANASGTGSVGVRYADWAQDCWDQFTTFENISGQAAMFAGSSVSGIVKPLLCSSLNPRIYAPGAVVAGILDPAYVFGAAASCYAGPVRGYQSAKVWVRFLQATGQSNNTFEFFGPIDPATAVGSIILFDASTAPSNMAIGYTSANTARRRVIFTPSGTSFEVQANGYAEQHNAANTKLIAGPGAANRLQLCSNDGTVLVDARGDQNRVNLTTVPTFAGGTWNGVALFHLGNYALWVDGSGRLRIKNGDPTGDSDGAIVGSQ